MMKDCIFCQIIAGEAPATIVYTDERVTAFYDIHPITPVHLLIVPNQHIESVNDIEEGHEALLGHLMVVAKRLAVANGLEQRGYRLVINTGPDAGQSVFHLHLHLIGGRRMPFRFQ